MATINKRIYHYKLMVILSVITLMHSNALAQELIYNLNKSNGLPTNHVYCAIVDHNGYLWMGTENGVIRYNGYETRKYDYADGLPNVDVWGLYEDNSNRILLHTIARRMGYIKNNRYRPFYLKNHDTSNIKIQPSLYQQVEDTGYFWNVIGNAKELHGSFARIVGDTIHFKSLNYFYKTPKRLSNNTFHIPHLGIFTYKNNKLYKTDQDGVEHVQCNINSSYMNDIGTQLCATIKNELIIYNINSDSLFHLNIKTCESEVIKLPHSGGDSIQTLKYLYTNNDNLYIVSNDYIYIYNDKIKLSNQYRIADIVNLSLINNSSISYFINSPLWGVGLTTNDNGVFLTFKHKNATFTPTKNNYSTTIFLNHNDNGLSYWWDKRKNVITTIHHTTPIKNLKIDGINEANSIEKVFGDMSLLLAEPINYAIQNNSYSPFRKKYKYTNAVEHELDDNIKDEHIKAMLLDKDLKSLANVNDSTFYGVTGGYIGLHRYHQKSKDSIVINLIDTRKYKRVVYDSFNKNIIAYYDDIITKYNIKTKKLSSITPTELKEKGIDRIEQLYVYNKDYLLIQDYNDIFLYNTHTNEAKHILNNYFLEGAIVDVTSEQITIGGRFGIGQYRYVNDSLVTEKLFLNTKSLFYNELLNMCVGSKYILVGTDKGSYEIDLTNPTQNHNAVENDYRIIADYNDTVHNIITNDTIKLAQETAFISFDAINPAGYGSLKFKYKINDEQWEQSDGKNISIYNLTSNTYHTIQIIAFDDAWTSAPITIKLFVIPYWWQTTGGRSIIIILTLIAISLLVFIAITITRKRIEQVNQRKNQQRDLELKSIYSQINPHFIFNTLGTAQYFIKKNKTKEAYAHISQFSDLLRAYLKSSRDKYISITEEVENLKNYLELQLSRFEHKFIYDISVDKSINPDTTTIPSLLLQPIVENALNHGIFHMDGLGQLNIKFLKENNNLICIVDDNGIGRKKSKQLRSSIIRKADSYGTILIKELIDTFNKYEPISIILEYIDKHPPETGTTVKITIDNINSNLKK